MILKTKWPLAIIILAVSTGCEQTEGPLNDNLGESIANVCSDSTEPVACKRILDCVLERMDDESDRGETTSEHEKIGDIEACIIECDRNGFGQSVCLKGGQKAFDIIFEGFVTVSGDLWLRVLLIVSILSAAVGFAFGEVRRLRKLKRDLEANG